MTGAGPHSQSGFDVRMDWGVSGLADIRSGIRSVVVVDVLAFTTSVEVACCRGAHVYPAAWKGPAAGELATRLGASLAVARTEADEAHPYSLSPASMLAVISGERIVLPSPHGASASLAATELGVPVFAGCLRNRRAVAAAANRPRPVAVIAAGERRADGSLRPAWEDLIGGGAIIDALAGTRSPESTLAGDAWRAAADDPLAPMLDSASGRELVEGGYSQDVHMAATTDVSDYVPMLIDGAFVSGVT